MLQIVTAAKNDKSKMFEDTAPVFKDECELINGIITWRHMLGDTYNGRDYLDFSIPRPEEELSRLCSAVNNTFSDFGAAMRVVPHNGVIIPAIKV